MKPRHLPIRLLILLIFAILFVASVALSIPVRFLLGARAIDSTPNRHDGQIQVDGRTRTYFVHTPPAYDAKTPLPMVIVIHGGGGNAESAEKMSRMSLQADQKNFLVAYPNGTGRFEDHLLTWNTGNCCAYALKNNVDDVAFFRALIAKLERDYSVDPNRLFVTGMSNGGMMTYLAACNLADKIAAIAPVAGAQNFDCHPSQPVSVIAFHGTADENVPFNGGSGSKSIGGPRDDRPVSYAINFWTKQDGCAAAPQHTESGTLRTDLYAPCQSGTAVELNAIEGQGHAWPGGDRGLRILDQPDQTISATNLMWAFFEQHPKR
jgi:polyhydroxybutyrate depolymerase